MNEQEISLDELPDLIPVAQVAIYLHVSQRTVMRMNKRGELPILKVGRKNLVQRFDLRALLEQRKSQQKPDRKTAGDR